MSSWICKKIRGLEKSEVWNFGSLIVHLTCMKHWICRRIGFFRLLSEKVLKIWPDLFHLHMTTQRTGQVKLWQINTTFQNLPEQLKSLSFKVRRDTTLELGVFNQLHVLALNILDPNSLEVFKFMNTPLVSLTFNDHYNFGTVSRWRYINRPRKSEQIPS